MVASATAAAIARPRPRGPRPARARRASCATGAGRPGPPSITSIRTPAASARPRTTTGPAPCSIAFAIRLSSRLREPQALAAHAGRVARPAQRELHARSAAVTRDASTESASSSRGRTCSIRRHAQARAADAVEIVERQRRPPELEVDRPQPGRRELDRAATELKPEPGRGDRSTQLVAGPRDRLHRRRARAPRRAASHAASAAASQPASAIAGVVTRPLRRPAGSRRPTR